MRELNIEPSQTSTGSTNYTRSVSDKAIAQQFCLVATDIRSTLQVLRESVDVQKQILIAIQDMSSKIDQNNEKIDHTAEQITCMHECLDTANKSNIDHVHQLTKNTEMLVKAFTSEEAYQTLLNNTTS